MRRIFAHLYHVYELHESLSMQDYTYSTYCTVVPYDDDMSTTTTSKSYSLFMPRLSLLVDSCLSPQHSNTLIDETSETVCVRIRRQQTVSKY
jgi:hypothetical protein